MGDPYYAPKEEPNEAKDSVQLRKLEERDKQIKYAKKLGKPMHSSKARELSLCSHVELHRGAAG